MADEGTASILINATAERIMDVVQDIEAYPDWMPVFRRAEVTQRDGEGRPAAAEFEVDARIKVLNYSLSYAYTPSSISWDFIEGDVKQIKGSYQLDSQGDSTKVTYEYSIDPGFPVPGFLRKQAIKMMVSSALNDLKKRAESD